MSTSVPRPEPITLWVVHFPPDVRLTDEQFFQFCRLNDELRIERNAQGDMEIMAPTGGNTGKRNAKLLILFGAWALQDGTGEVFDSSTGFVLPNGATRSPDVSWVRKERLQLLTEEQAEQFLPLCPDFAVEIRSRSDRLNVLKEKMSEYIENGASLGWLIDPFERKVYVYRPQTGVVVLENPQTLSDESLFPGLVLDLRPIWETAPTSSQSE